MLADRMVWSSTGTVGELATGVGKLALLGSEEAGSIRHAELMSSGGEGIQLTYH